MSASGNYMGVSVAAGADLSAAQYKVVVVAGTIAAANNGALGILQNKPQSGEHASVGYFGHMKAYVGGAISAGDRLKVTTSGWLAGVSSGNGAVGIALTAAASGALCEGLFNFPGIATTY